jgi:hypothetical protein
VRISVAPGRTSSRHALHVCGTGAIASCAPGQFVLGQTSKSTKMQLGYARVPHPISVENRRGGLSARPWMNASFVYASSDSLDMSWLPLPRFESRALCVAVCSLGAGSEGRGKVPHPISVESRRGGLSARPWMSASFGYASVGSLDMSWLPLPRFESRAVRVAVPRRE